MDLQCEIELAQAYRSRSQVARVLSEAWCRRELYCPACDSNALLPTRPNTKVLDFTCPKCGQLFELKSSSRWNSFRIPDVGYEAMVQAIRNDRAPNLFLLQYSSDWLVTDLLVVPRVFFVESMIEKRPPLAPTARRAGWVGCNILLGRIPEDGKIAVVSGGKAISACQVRNEFSRTRDLAVISPAARGWTVEVLRIVRQLGRKSFALADVYEREKELQAVHPQNRNVRPKIRQQLQVLRDLGLLRFEGRGVYSLV